jgi:hypothetical protein
MSGCRRGSRPSDLVDCPRAGGTAARLLTVIGRNFGPAGASVSRIKSMFQVLIQTLTFSDCLHLIGADRFSVRH